MTLVHINRPRGHHVGQVREYGHRRWRTVTGKCAIDKLALALAVRRMGKNDHRARSLFIDDSGYYEPHVTMEAKR